MEMNIGADYMIPSPSIVKECAALVMVAIGIMETTGILTILFPVSAEIQTTMPITT